ncbi:hypothetical protein COI51_23130 [Bacillus toyonensis]|uniref:hypothetical protein n=1 Tax=Bacillus cereus group TaxID=86661 RepID=UPI000BEDF703|nr:MULTISPECIES: hypothetical protein [Bacillus cereus group]MBJ7929121.1 hypothetical protein [Bacillus cereus group sp. N31]PEG14211.1 hypothetical protein COO04_21025 [Bacillus toyonensis]PEM19887.1 hypothetical protein CN616_09540 [Bacillus toyonensis]PFZ78671.1 hypothetical protein COL82_09165 [Bacillus toyonensis]PGA11103.1 hypothetical protein COL67_01850 [Bacillus toyonensis]
MIDQLKWVRKRTIILTVIILLLTVILVRNSTWYISRSFSSEFFRLAMPLDSKVIKDYEADEKNWIEIGNGGYWEVVANRIIETKQSKAEVISFYQKIGKLKYPNSNVTGVEIQLYFKDDSKVVENEKGNYYRDKMGDIRYVNEYAIEDIKKEKQPSDSEMITYVIQVHTQFDYWYKLD